MNGCCPLTRKKLTIKDFLPSFVIKNLCDRYREKSEVNENENEKEKRKNEERKKIKLEKELQSSQYFNPIKIENPDETYYWKVWIFSCDLGLRIGRGIIILKPDLFEMNDEEKVKICYDILEVRSYTRSSPGLMMKLTFLKKNQVKIQFEKKQLLETFRKHFQGLRNACQEKRTSEYNSTQEIKKGKRTERKNQIEHENENKNETGNQTQNQNQNRKEKEKKKGKKKKEETNSVGNKNVPKEEQTQETQTIIQNSHHINNKQKNIIFRLPPNSKIKVIKQSNLYNRNTQVTNKYNENFFQFRVDVVNSKMQVMKSGTINLSEKYAEYQTFGNEKPVVEPIETLMFESNGRIGEIGRVRFISHNFVYYLRFQSTRKRNDFVKILRQIKVKLKSLHKAIFKVQFLVNSNKKKEQETGVEKMNGNIYSSVGIKKNQNNFADGIISILQNKIYVQSKEISINKDCEEVKYTKNKDLVGKLLVDNHKKEILFKFQNTEDQVKFELIWANGKQKLPKYKIPAIRLSRNLNWRGTVKLITNNKKITIQSAKKTYETHLNQLRLSIHPSTDEILVMKFLQLKRTILLLLPSKDTCFSFIRLIYHSQMIDLNSFKITFKNSLNNEQNWKVGIIHINSNQIQIISNRNTFNEILKFSKKDINRIHIEKIIKKF